MTEYIFTTGHTEKSFIVPTLYVIAIDGHFDMTITLKMNRAQFKGPGKIAVMIVAYSTGIIYLAVGAALLFTTGRSELILILLLNA
jgi:hypothetical protein